MIKKGKIRVKNIYILDSVVGGFLGFLLSLLFHIIFFSVVIQTIDKRVFNLEAINSYIFSIKTLALVIFGGFLGFIYREKRKIVIRVFIAIPLIFLLFLLLWYIFWHILIGKITEI